MIRWCCYCQRVLGEMPPYDRPALSHCICPACEAHLERDEPIGEATEPLRAFVKQILQSARDGDEQVFAGILPRARAIGLDTEALLLAVLQPALYQAGVEWEAGRLSVATEHRLSTWCEHAFSLIAAPPRRRPVEILLLQAPGNLHTIGPRFAARVLAARGREVDVVVPGLPLPEIVTLTRELTPRVIGFSCSLATQVPAVVELIGRLRDHLEPALPCRYVLSGLAFRLGGGADPPAVPAGVEIALDLSYLAPSPAEAGVQPTWISASTPS